MLAWAAETWSSSSEKKSALIRAVQATLKGDTLRFFRDFLPTMQASFATVWVFACPSIGTRGQDLMMSWLSRYREIAVRTGPTACPSFGGANPPPCLTILAILIGCTAGYQHMMLDAAFKLATLRDVVEFKLLPVLCCCADRHTETVTSTLASQRSFIPMDKVLTESELAAKVDVLLPQWHSDSVKVLIVTSLPLLIKQFAKNEDPEAVLHSPAARHLWFSQALSGHVMSVMGQTAVIDVVIAPFNLASEASSLLQKSVGPLIAQNMSQDDLQGSQQILFLQCDCGWHWFDQHARI